MIKNDTSVKRPKKITLWASLLLLFVLLSSVFLLPKLSSQARKNNPASLARVGGGDSNYLLQDNDRDGLQNWEEQIYGTDPNNPDTDGDGTSDGDEVKAGRNPLVKGPNDYLNTPDTTESAANQQPQNLTQSIFSDVIQKGGIIGLTQGKNSGFITNQVNQKVDELIASGQLSSPTNTETISLPYMKTSPDTSVAAVKNYLGQVADTMRKDLSSFKKDDLDLFLEILQAEKLARLGELTPYRQALEKTTTDLNGLVVPKNMAWFQAKEIGYLQKSSQQITAFENADTDPAAAMAAIPARMDLKIDFTVFHKAELLKWIYENKIPLQASDKAVYLLN